MQIQCGFPRLILPARNINERIPLESTKLRAKVKWEEKNQEWFGPSAMCLWRRDNGGRMKKQF
jgi:hypothetical protein